MTELFKYQLLHELREAGYDDAMVAEDGKSVVPMPEHPDLQITSLYVQSSLGMAQEDRDALHWALSDIKSRALDACRAWENSSEMPIQNKGTENYRLLSEFNDILLAARSDGTRGLYFATWAYDEDRTGLEYGSYTSSFTAALQDYATRAGLVPKEQIIDPANAPVLYKALQTMESNYWMTKEQQDQVDQLCQQLEQLDRHVADKAEAIHLETADVAEQGMQGMQGL